MSYRWGCFGFVVLLLLPTALSAQNGSLVFLKAFYPLDEPHFHCVDIPGHKSRVDTSRPLNVHTCKEGIWHKDELFDLAALKDGQLKMPEYGLCVTASSSNDGATLAVKATIQSASLALRKFSPELSLKAHSGSCLTIGAEKSRLTPGGRRLPSRHLARSLQLEECSETAFQRQLWRFEVPQQRSGSVLPFAN